MPHTNINPALIIGGSSGIGRATAERLLKRGVGVHLVARDTERLSRAAEELSSLGSVRATGLDLYDEADVDRFINTVRESVDPIRHLVNAAGYFSPLSFLEHSRADYDRYHDLNRATYFVTQAVAHNMKANGGGSIVNIGSMWAKQAIKATPSSAYSMAKAGLHSLTQHLAMGPPWTPEIFGRWFSPFSTIPSLRISRRRAGSTFRLPSAEAGAFA